jgi:hypothetical protein
MDTQAISTLIGSVGFPIVMCLIMVKVMMQMEESHKTEIESLKESLNNNTNVLTKLETMLSMLAGKENEIHDNERN